MGVFARVEIDKVLYQHRLKSLSKLNLVKATELLNYGDEIGVSHFTEHSFEGERLLSREYFSLDNVHYYEYL